MANLKFTSDIIDDVLFRAGEPVDGSSDFEAAALEYVNRAYRAIWTGGGEFIEDMNEAWLWLKKDPPGVLTLNPVIDTGTVSVTQGSATATLSAVQATSMAGRLFKVDDHSDVFRVSAHTAGTDTLTLDAAYTGDTDTAATFKLMQVEYTLAADVLRIIAPMRVQSNMRHDIEGCDLVSLDRDFPLAFITAGVPDRFALVTETKVRFSHYGGSDSTELIRVEYDYLRKAADLTNSVSEEPLVPLEFRQVLSDCALYLMFTSKSDDRAANVGAQAKAGLRSMIMYNRNRVQQMGRSTGALLPRPTRTSWRQNVRLV